MNYSITGPKTLIIKAPILEKMVRCVAHRDLKLDNFLIAEGELLTERSKLLALNPKLSARPSKAGKIMAQKPIEGDYSTYFGGPGRV